MFPFVVVYIIIFLLSFKIKKDKFNWYDICILLTLVLFSGLRTVGIDYHLYSKIYSADIVLERTGIGYSYLMHFWKYILNFEYQSLIFFISLITILSIYYFFKKNSIRPGLSILIYVSLGFYSTSFNMFRQSCSIAFILLGSHFLKNNKKTKYMLSFLIAFLLHSSSLIAIVCFIVTEKFKNIKIKIKYILPVIFLAIFFYDEIFHIAISLLDGYAMYASYNSKPRNWNIH